MPPSLLAAAPGLVVVGDAQARPEPADTRWVAALPPAARVLELSAGGSALAAAYKRRHRGAHWTLVSPGGATGPAGDVDVWADPASLPTGPFDLLLLPDLLPWLADPAGTLQLLGRLAAPGARLMLRVANAASYATLQALLDGDLGVPPGQAPGPGQPRLMSHAVAYRMLLDAGWMPTLMDAHGDETRGRDPATQAVLETLVASSGLSNARAQRTLRHDRLVIEARRAFDDLPDDTPGARFDVVVPTNDEQQLRVNVEASPGLREVDARVVSVRGASSAGDAFERGREHARHDWVLFAHQDVYFPAGFGRRLSALLAGIAPEERARTVVGFVGLGAGAQGRGATPSGFVIDRLHRVDHPDSGAAVSIDELAVVLSRDSLLVPDPALGWHLWATDLCLRAVTQHGALPRIVRAPLFHNSRTGWTLPAAFVESARTLVAKWRHMGPLHTLCATLDDSFFARTGRPAP